MVRAISRASAALVAFALLGSAALAQEPAPSQLAAARELMDATGVLNPVNELIPSFTDQIRKQNVARPELSKDLDAVLKALEPEMGLQRQQITNVVSRTYAKWLTEAELRELVTFFKSPLGAKYNRVQADLVDDVVNDVQVWTQQASEYLIVRVRAEMAKRGHQLQ